MADERDQKLSQRYRELGREEPPRELDQTILAAAHRAADKPHAPLVTPAGRHRWYFAFGAAAILVLAVAITVHVERQQPDPEAMAAAAAAAEPPPPSQGPLKDQARETRRAPASPPSPREKVERRAETAEPRIAAAQVARAESPQRWLERILELRKEGRHEEAEKQLAEFRRRYPDYKIPEAALKRD